MSIPSSVRTLPASANLESLKKEAKRWLKALRDSESQALDRYRSVVPTASAEFNLREVQHALALEYGTTSWGALKEVLADRKLASLSVAERASDFLRHALDRQSGNLSAHILSKHPDVARFSIHTAAVCGDLNEVQRRLHSDPSAASSIGGPNNWQPLQYVCYARVPVAQTSDNSLAIARALMDAGADPKATFIDAWTNPFTLVTGAIGAGEQQHAPHAHAVELVALLIERGADPYDPQCLYNTSLRKDDTFWLDFLYSRSESAGTTEKWRKPNPDSWPKESGMLEYLLGNAVSRNHLQRARWLLVRGAQVTVPHFYTKRDLYTEALLCGFTDMTALLLEFGAKPRPLSEYETFQAACMSCNQQTVLQLLTTHPEYLNAPWVMFAAVNNGKIDVVDFLLSLGMSANAADGSWTVLHAAACTGAVPTAKLLIERGATIDTLETKYQATPLGHAAYAGNQAMVDYLSLLSRDVFTFVSTGNMSRLREVLDTYPDLIHGTRFGKSLLFFLSSPEENAIQIAELLLQRGCDRTTKDADGKTASDVATGNGFNELAEVLQA